MKVFDAETCKKQQKNPESQPWNIFFEFFARFVFTN